MIELLYLSHLFLPIPFMLLYRVQTKKLNRFTNIVVLAPIIGAIILFLLQVQVPHSGTILVMFYSFLLALGTYIFRQKYDLPQALSLAFNLAFFNSVYWEIPVHVYTLLYLGYFDPSFPLHFIYVFPLIFLYSKLRFPNPHRKQYLLFASGLVLSTICLIPRVLYNPFIWGYSSPPSIEAISYANRFVCFVILLKIFYNTKPICLTKEKKHGHKKYDQ